MRRPVRGVLLCSEAYAPIVDGVVNVVRTLDESLRQRGLRTHIVTTSMPGHVDELPHISRFPSIGLRLTAPYRVTVPCRASAYLPRHLEAAIDVVHVHSGFETSRAVVRWARRHSKPVVATIHSKYLEKMSNAVGPFLARGIYRRLLALMNEADVITAPGQRFGEELVRHGVDSRKLHIVPNGVAAWPAVTAAARGRFLADDPEGQRMRLARERGEAILLFVGQLIPEKNPDLLVESLGVLRRRGAPFVCHVVGDGPQRAALQRRARALGLEGHVRFVGEVIDRRRLSLLFEQSDLFAFPSTYESYPLVVMEAAQHRLPTVGIAGASGVSEVVIDGETGFLAPLEVSAYADQLQSALADRRRLASIGERARVRIPRAKDEMVESFLSIYRGVLSA